MMIGFYFLETCQIANIDKKPTKMSVKWKSNGKPIFVPRDQDHIDPPMVGPKALG